MPVGQGTLGESSSFSPLTVWVVAGCGKGRSIRDDSADILFQSFLQRAVVNVSGMVRDVHSLTLSIQYFLCRPQRRPLSEVPWRMVLRRPLWHVTCPNYTSFPSLDPQGSWSCSPPTRWSCAPRRKCGEVSSGTNDVRLVKADLFVLWTAGNTAARRADA